MSEPPSSGYEPHLDPDRWAELIAGIRAETMVSVIASAMSRQLRTQCTPEDVWQETLVHAWRDREQHRWRGETVFRAWLLEIARHRILESVRNLGTAKRGGGERTSRFSELGSTSSSSTSGLLPADSQTPSRIVARGEKSEALLEALASLPPDLEAILRLHLFDGLTMEEIAGQLGIGLSAAWHRFRKGSAMIEEILPGGIDDASARPS